MYSKDLLIQDGLPPIFDKKFQDLRTNIISGIWLDTQNDPESRFISKATNYFTSSKRNQLHNIHLMPYIDIVMGCNHFIDNIIMKHTIDGIQVVEHDYKYYSRLKPDIAFSQIGNLESGKPLLVAAPIPGYLNMHPQWHDLLDECTQKHIQVHIDACWLGSATNITIDLAPPCIASMATSLSKGLGMGWNRIGIRWSRHLDVTDSVYLYNKFRMIPEALIRNALVALEHIPIDYLWDTYEPQYQDICRALYLRPSNIIHAAFSIDRSRLFGLANFFNG
jgi:hypothetical protein